MKIGKIDQTPLMDTESSLSLALLLHRFGDELCTMATTCRNVENALGVVIGKPENPVDQSIISIQGLDKMRQTLEDLARLSRVISRNKTLTSVEMSPNEISNTVVLAGLAESLSASQSEQPDESDNEHDVLWM